MTASLIDHLAPEDQIHLAYIAWSVLALSAVLWAFGIGIARIATAAALGVICALAAIFLGAKFGLTFSPITLGIIGGAIGLVLGSLGFGIVQAVTLSLCLGIAVAGLYHRWHLRYEPDDPSLVTRPASELLMTIQAPATGWDGVKQALIHHVQTIPESHLKHMIIAGVGSLICAVLVALTFPRATTVSVTAFLGAIGVALAVYCLFSIYRPELSAVVPESNKMRLLWLLLFTGLGALIQWSIFVRRVDKKPEEQPPQDSPVPAAA